MTVGANRRKNAMIFNKNAAPLNKESCATAFIANIKNACQPIATHVDAMGSFKGMSFHIRSRTQGSAIQTRTHAKV